MLNKNAEPYQHQEEMIHIMSPSAYYYHEATLPPPPPFPRKLLNSIYPNPPSIPVTPDQLCNQKPSSNDSPLPLSRPPPPSPPPHHHQQQPVPVSGKTQEYYWPMQRISNKKTTETITTVMMRGIPPSISREMLMEIVDKHCIKENKKAISHHQDAAILSEYDFLYMPINFMSTRNLGYAFVNFTTCIAAKRFYKAFDNLSWMEKMFIDSPKICEITPARFQGKDVHVSHFKNFQFKCDTDEFLPISFSPPRNGSTSLTLPSIVGKKSRIGMQIHRRIKLNL